MVVLHVAHLPAISCVLDIQDRNEYMHYSNAVYLHVLTDVAAILKEDYECRVSDRGMVLTYPV